MHALGEDGLVAPELEDQPQEQGRGGEALRPPPPADDLHRQIGVGTPGHDLVHLGPTIHHTRRAVPPEDGACDVARRS